MSPVSPLMAKLRPSTVTRSWRSLVGTVPAERWSSDIPPLCTKAQDDAHRGESEVGRTRLTSSTGARPSTGAEVEGEGVMSTIFEVPCPDCGRSMVVEATGNLQCPTCHRGYRA